MVVVSNSSPLIAFVRIQRLDLLSAIFEAVLIPPAVAREISPSIPVLPAWPRIQAPNVLPPWRARASVIAPAAQVQYSKAIPGGGILLKRFSEDNGALIRPAALTQLYNFSLVALTGLAQRPREQSNAVRGTASSRPSCVVGTSPARSARGLRRLSSVAWLLASLA